MLFITNSLLKNHLLYFHDNLNFFSMPDAKVGFQLRYNYFNEHKKCEISAHKKKKAIA